MRTMMMATAATLLLALPAQAQTQPADLHAAIAADYDANLEALFLDFHRNPELSGLEVRTSGIIAAQLRGLGYEVTTGVGGTGVVAVLRNGPGPTVMLRADMDGLPLRENSGLPYASSVIQTDTDGTEKPVMHACGHDVHVTALIGTARQMMARRDSWSGTLVLIAQPAEERIGGARAMVADGLYTRFPKPDYAVAFHVKAQLPAGMVEVPLTIAYSSSDSVDITVRGVGGHGAYPHLTVDPVLIASQIVVSLQSIRSRNINPLEGAVITVGAINGGIKHNIIPDEVRLQLTVRSDSFAVREQLLDGIDRVVRGTAEAYGVPEDRMPIVERSPTESTPPTINDEATAVRVRDALAAELGADRMTAPPRSGMGAEDFAYYVLPEYGVRGVYFNVGGGRPEDAEHITPHHSALFRIAPEESVTTGVEAMVTAATALMPKP
ncbi:MAG: amidohydrolase [Pseudomonadota bacterium]